MKANEFRLGNLVYYHIEDKMDERKEWDEISPIDYDDLRCFVEYEDNSEYRPIPLTEEWLKKFGFEKVMDKISDHFNVGFYHYENKDCWIYLIEDGFELELITLDERNNFARTYKYVHQLQNLYFALTGEELTPQE